MGRVGIVGYGMTPFTRKDDRIEMVLAGSVRDLFEGSSISRDGVDAVLVSTNDNSKYLSPIVSEMAGIAPRTAHTVENLCNSGTNSLVSAYSYIASGLADMVLVSGAEKTDSPGRVLQWDVSRGEFKHPIFWASMFTKSYKQRYSVSDEQLALVPVKNHKHARKNPNALSQRACSVEDVLDSKRLTEDLRLLDCSRSCTGGASVLLASEETARQYSKSPVWITGIGQRTISAGFAKNPELSSMKSTSSAGASALKMSNHDTRDIDVMELHDAFSVCEPIILESLGFSEPGMGTDTVREAHETDNYRINPRGGLIGAGHPLGATGIAQTVEIVRQLQSSADNQVSNARVGLVHNMSAAATSCTVLVLENGL